MICCPKFSKDQHVYTCFKWPPLKVWLKACSHWEGWENRTNGDNAAIWMQCVVFLFMQKQKYIKTKTIFGFVSSLFSLSETFLRVLIFWTKEQLGSGIWLCSVMCLFHTRVDWQNGLWPDFLSAVECTTLISVLTNLQASVVLKDAQILCRYCISTSLCTCLHLLHYITITVLFS